MTHYFSPYMHKDFYERERGKRNVGAMLNRFLMFLGSIFLLDLIWVKVQFVAVESRSLYFLSPPFFYKWRAEGIP